MPLPIPSWELFVGIASETTWGTAVAATDYYPIAKPKFTVKYAPIEDIGFRSNASELQAWYQGVGNTLIDLPDMLFYPNATGHLLMGMLGVDTNVTTTHTLTLLNTALPKSYSLYKFWGGVATVDQVAGVFWSDLQFKFMNPGKLTVAAKGTGKIQTQGTQDATGGNVGPLRVTGKITAASVDLTELNFYLNNTQPVASVTFTSGANSLQFQMSKAAFVDPSELDHGNPYARTVLT